VLPTVGFPVVQFNAIQQPFIAVDIVPITVFQSLSKRTFNLAQK
jgi:hypothetical protein